jgi:hypothetical protein
VVGSCLLCPWGCQWQQKLCLLLRGPSLIFNPSFAENQPCMTQQSQRNLFSYTMVFVGSIWKNKSGWFLFVVSPELSVAIEIVLTAGAQHCWFSTQVLLRINPAWHHRASETLLCPYDGVCWIHMEE